MNRKETTNILILGIAYGFAFASGLLLALYMAIYYN